MSAKRKNGSPVTLELTAEQVTSVTHSIRNSLDLYRRYIKLRPESHSMHNKQEAARRHIYNLSPVLKRLRTAR